MPRSHKKVENLLIKLEQSLREAMLWSHVMPSAEALESKVPFAFDTMPFEHWLQFIFIPKMFALVSSKSILPEKFELLPMAEQSFGASNNLSGVIEVIRQIDLAFSHS